MNTHPNINQSYILQLRQQLGSVIKEKRKAKGMDQSELGEAVGITYSTISKIESGQFPTAIDTYLKIGVALDFEIKFT